MTAKEIIEREDIVIENGAFYKRECLEKCPHTTICKYCKNKLSKTDSNIIHNAIEHNQL